MKSLNIKDQGMQQTIELWWHVTILIIVSGTFGIILFQPLLLMIFYGFPILLIQHKYQILSILKKRWHLWLIIGLAYISAIWALHPDISLSLSTLFTFATLYALLLSVRYTYNFIVEIFKLFTIIIVSLNIFAIIIGYDQSQNQIFPDSPFWNGAFYHKNILGRVCVLTFIVCLLQIRSSSKLQRLLWLGLAVTSVGLIVYANSITALITVIIILCIMTVWIVLQRMEPFFAGTPTRLFQFAIIIASFLIPSMVIFLLSLDNVLDIFGRNTQLTGRTYLWQILLPFIWQNPVLGYGFGTAFWEIPRRVRLESWMIHAHNLYLETWLQLGLGGLVLTLMLIFQLFKDSLHSFHKRGDEKSLFCLLFLIFVLVYSVSESDLIAAKVDVHWVWILFAYFYFSTYSEQVTDSTPNIPSLALSEGNS